MKSTRLSTRALALVSMLVLLLTLGAGGAGAAKQRTHRALDGDLPPGAINNEYYASTGLAPPTGYHCEHYQGGVGAVPSGTTVGPDCSLRGVPNSNYGDFTFGVAFVPDSHPLDQTGAIFAGNYHVFIEFIQWVPPTLDGTAGEPYSRSVRAYANNGVSFTYAIVDGAAPPGTAMRSDGFIVGTPTRAGNFQFTVRATDTNGLHGDASYVAQIANRPIALTPATLPDALTGAAYGVTLIAANGTAPYVYTLTAGTLPPGLTLSSGGIITGSPTKQGAFLFTVRATDTSGSFAAQAYTLVVNYPPLVFAPDTLPDATSESAYSQTLTVTGGTAPYTFALATGSTLPPGLTMNAQGAITGTPSAKAGPFKFSVVVTDQYGAPATKDYTLNLKAPTISMTPGTFKPATSGKQYAATIVAAGGKGPYAYSLASGDLPPGLKLGSDGVVAGTPSAPAGNFSFTVNAVDANGAVGTSQFQIVLLAPTITLKPKTLAGGVVGAKYHASISASGGEGPYTFSVKKGKVAPGIHMSAKGTFDGKPKKAGTYSFTIAATDKNGATATIAVKLTVVANPTKP